MSLLMPHSLTSVRFPSKCYLLREAFPATQSSQKRPVLPPLTPYPASLYLKILIATWYDTFISPSIISCHEGVGFVYAMCISIFSAYDNVWFILGAQLTFFIFEIMLSKLPCTIETWNIFIITCINTHIFMDYPIFIHVPLLAQITQCISKIIFPTDSTFNIDL